MFNFSEIMLVFKVWLRVIVIASIRNSFICCNNFVDNPSGPVLCLGLSSLNILVILVLFMLIADANLGPTLQKYILKLFTMSFIVC